MNKSRLKLLSSRYYEPFQSLSKMVSPWSVFELVYNEDKETYHLPYLYGGYEDKLNPIAKSSSVIEKIENYLDANLFTNEERKILVKELISVVEELDKGIRKWSKRYIEAPESEEKEKNLEYINQLKKSIANIEQIKSLTNKHLSILYSRYIEEDFKKIKNANKGESKLIIDHLYSIGSSLMKYPKTHQNKDEESIRDLFLVSLSGRYSDSVATGESYNFKGKTDIIVKRVDGSNLLIVECKIWKGKKYFNDSISQLLTKYVSTVDRNLSLIYFVKNNDFQSTKNKAIIYVTENDSYLNLFLNKGNELGFKSEFKNPIDSSDTVFIEFMFFHLMD